MSLDVKPMSKMPNGLLADCDTALLQGSYIPNREQRELRELIRYRRRLIDERAREIQRIQKVLEGANIKLSSVVTDVMGKSGRLMIEGETDPELLFRIGQTPTQEQKTRTSKSATRADGPTSTSHVEGAASAYRRFGPTDSGTRWRSQEADVPLEEDLNRLDTIPGVGRRSVEQESRGNRHRHGSIPLRRSSVFMGRTGSRKQ